MDSQDRHHSMPIKPGYSSLIKESRDEKTDYLLFEYFDDASYSDSSYCCMEIRTRKGRTQLILSSDKGPQQKEILTKILQWRISGDSEEIGHKGGGNKRCIYGHPSDRVSIISVIGPDSFIRAETNPDKIFELSQDPSISESDFQNMVDKQCIKWATSIQSLEDDGGWINTYRETMEQVGLPVDYIMCFDLTSIKDEYTDAGKWDHLVDRIRMKNYTIPIYVKNELTKDTEFHMHENMDMIGLHHQVPLTTVEVYLEGNEFIIHKDGKYVNMKGEEIDYKSTWVLFGPIDLYTIQAQYLQDSLHTLNKALPKEARYTMEDFYGVYIVLNKKQTNYLPVQDNLLPLSKQMGDFGNSRFRVVFRPICENVHLESIIKTDTVKAKTGFKDSVAVKKLLNEVRKLMKPSQDEPLHVTVKKKKEARKKGQIYVVYLGKTLFKYGMITEEDNMQTRMKDHKLKSNEKIKEFVGEITTEKICIPIYYSTPMDHPKAAEEYVGRLLYEDSSSKITLFQHAGQPNSQREYFTCSDPQYMKEAILPAILRYQTEKLF
jgi:hypothetical protein